MMDLKRVRGTICSLVDKFCSGEHSVSSESYNWVSGQVSFAYVIDAITTAEMIEFNSRLSSFWFSRGEKDA